MMNNLKLYTDLAEYYFTIEDNHRDIDDDISLIRSLLHGRETPNLLDLGCGTGEHLNKLNRYGIICSGLDSSEEMLRIAKRRFPHKITFLRDDMRNFDFYDEFDIIISLFGSFNYMVNDTDVERVLWNTWRALKPDGIGIFEIWNSVPVKMINKKEITHVSTTKHDETIIERERGFKLLPDQNKTLVEVDYKYTLTNGNGTSTITDKHVMRTFTTDEIKHHLENNGFSLQNIYANFLKETYKDHSNRMIIYFTKD